jgi:hypothetical protein
LAAVIELIARTASRHGSATGRRKQVVTAAAA